LWSPKILKIDPEGGSHQIFIRRRKENEHIQSQTIEIYKPSNIYNINELSEIQ